MCHLFCIRAICALLFLPSLPGPPSRVLELLKTEPGIDLFLMISEVFQWIVQRVSLTEIVFFPVSRVSAFQIMVGFLVWREILTKFC